MHPSSVRWVALGAALLVAAQGAGLIVFWVLAALVCGSSDCYGDNASAPLILAGVVVLVTMLIGIGELKSRYPRTSGRAPHVMLGSLYLMLALPIAAGTFLVVTARYCPGACNGDYMLMALDGLVAAALITISLATFGVRLITFQPGEVDRQATGGTAPVASDRPREGSETGTA